MRCPLSANSRVWIYTRESGGDDQDVGDQQRAVEAYCRDNSLTLERSFCDEARPGSSVVGREQFQQMMRMARTLSSDQLPDGLILWSFARFAREIDDAQFFKSDLRRRGIAIVSIMDNIPTDDPLLARLIENITDYRNAQFLEDLRHNVKRGLHDIASQGYSPGGFPPAGYKAEKVTIGTKRGGEPRIVSIWIPDPDVAPRVRQAWEMRARGASYKEIHEATRVFGATNSYSCMFRNKTYLGVRKCGDLEVADAHEALVTPEMWEAVQKTLITRPKRGERWPEGRPHPRRAGSPFLLSGLAVCAHCGSAMCGGHDNVNTRPQPWPYYLCGRKRRQGWKSCEGGKIGARKVEAALLEVVLQSVLTPDLVTRLIEGVNVHLAHDLDGLDRRIDETRQRLAEVERAIGNLLDLVEVFGAKAAATRILEQEAEQEGLQRELVNLQLRRQQSRIEVSPEAILAVIGEAQDGFASEDVEVKRTVLRRFVSKVELGRERGRLWYTFPLQAVTGVWIVPPRRPELNPCLEFVWIATV